MSDFDFKEKQHPSVFESLFNLNSDYILRYLNALPFQDIAINSTHE